MSKSNSARMKFAHTALFGLCAVTLGGCAEEVYNVESDPRFTQASSELPPVDQPASPTPNPSSPGEPQDPKTPEPVEKVEFTSIGSMSRITINGEQFSSTQHAGKDWSIRQSQNGKIFRFEIRQGEGRPGKDPSSDRAEFQHIGNFEYGSDVWISYAFKHETNDQLNEIPQTVVGQFHDDSNVPGASPSFCFRIRNGEFGVETISGVDRGDFDRIRHYSKPLVMDQWHHIVARVRSNPYQNAILEIWINGEKVVDKTKFSIGYTKSKSSYVKFGLYRGTNPIPQAVQYTNVEIGTASLRHRVESPLPIVP